MMNDKKHKSNNLPDSIRGAVGPYIKKIVGDEKGTWEDMRRKYRKKLNEWEAIKKEGE